MNNRGRNNIEIDIDKPDSAGLSELSNVVDNKIAKKLCMIN